MCIGFIFNNNNNSRKKGKNNDPIVGGGTSWLHTLTVEEHCHCISGTLWKMTERGGAMGVAKNHFPLYFYFIF